MKVTAFQRLTLATLAVLTVGVTGAWLAASPAGAQPGYWLGADDGSVFSFNAPFFGSLGAGAAQNGLDGGGSGCATGCSIAAWPNSQGYWLLATVSGQSSFGHGCCLATVDQLFLAAYGLGQRPGEQLLVAPTDFAGKQIVPVPSPLRWRLARRQA